MARLGMFSLIDVHPDVRVAAFELGQQRGQEVPPGAAGRHLGNMRVSSR
jgi:hypothetical protein